MANSLDAVEFSPPMPQALLTKLHRMFMRLTSNGPADNVPARW